MKPISEKQYSQFLNFLNHSDQFVFLDTSKPDSENGQSLVFLEPVDRIQCCCKADLDHFFSKVKEYLGRGYFLAGWFAYEFGHLLEEKFRSFYPELEKRKEKLADLGVFKKPYYFDHETGKNNLPLSNCRQLENAEYEVAGIKPNLELEDYLQRIEKIKEYIRAGDTYQVNYTFKLLFNHTGSTEGFYRMMRLNQSVAYGALIKWGQERILSFSPELFFAKKNGTITVKPMKGTMKRGRTADEDRRRCLSLQNDEKNRSENVMIVDLLRNDLSSLMHHAGGGAVRVDSLFDVESFETLLQMTSTIRGQVSGATQQDLQPVELLKALFPCGSVTGAPKIRTMEIIGELEQEPRGVYTGAIGYLAPDGDAVFNVPIRTVVLNGDRGEMGIGSGIVYDSNPEDEWRECLLKGNFLTRPNREFLLIETVIWEPETGYWLLADHLDRLQQSAGYFLFPCDRLLIEKKLAEVAESFEDRFMRVRLTLAKDGQADVSWMVCDKPILRRLPDEPGPVSQDTPRIELYKEPIDTTSPYYFHKSTMREVYDRTFARAKEKGLFDICFFNRDNKLTEGCITNVFLYKNGVYATPPISCGLLAGVMRQQLLADNERIVVEKELTEEDVMNADAIFLCNSVRGVVRVHLSENKVAYAI